MSPPLIPREGPPPPCPTCGQGRRWTGDKSAHEGRRLYCATCQRARRAAKRGLDVEPPHEKRRRVARIAAAIPCPKHGARPCARKQEASPICPVRRAAVHELARTLELRGAP